MIYQTDREKLVEDAAMNDAGYDPLFDVLVEAAWHEVIEVPNRPKTYQKKNAWTPPATPKPPAPAPGKNVNIKAWEEFSNGKAGKTTRKVQIIKTNERGFWEWAVVRADDAEYWVDSFKLKREAVEFCRRNGFEIVGSE